MSSEDEAELWEFRGTWRLRCWTLCSCSKAGEGPSLLAPLHLPEAAQGEETEHGHLLTYNPNMYNVVSSNPCQ